MTTADDSYIPPEQKARRRIDAMLAAFRDREVGHREAHAKAREKQRRLAGQDVIRMRPDRGRDDERVMVGQDGGDRAGEVRRLRVRRPIGVVEEIQVDVTDPEPPEDPDVLLAPRVHSRPG